MQKQRILQFKVPEHLHEYTKEMSNDNLEKIIVILLEYAASNCILKSSKEELDGDMTIVKQMLYDFNHKQDLEYKMLTGQIERLEDRLQHSLDLGKALDIERLYEDLSNRLIGKLNSMTISTNEIVKPKITPKVEKPDASKVASILSKIENEDNILKRAEKETKIEEDDDDDYNAFDLGIMK